MEEKETITDEMIENATLDDLLEARIKIDDMIADLDMAIEECEEALNS